MIVKDNLHIVDHPLVQSLLTELRRIDTPPARFRSLVHRITTLMAFEVTKDFALRLEPVETPLTERPLPLLDVGPVTIVPILRAGLGMMDPLLDLLPSASVGMLGLQRNPRTHEPEEYYAKMPADLNQSLVLLVDPMLATGGSAVDALRSLKSKGCERIIMMNILAAPEGVAAVQQAFPTVPFYVAAVDECLNEHAYIVPGLGDAGDRYFNS